MTHSEKSIIMLLDSKYLQNSKYKLANTFVFDWESDFFVVNQNKYCQEFEIKISRADFFKDIHKKEKHNMLKHGYFIDHTYKNIRPNKFFYVVPENLIRLDEIPEYAGLMYVGEQGIYTVKDAPFLHKDKLNLDSILVNKFYYAWVNSNSQIYRLEKELETLKTTK